VVEKIKMAAAIVKETFTHPLTTSVIRVHGGEIQIERDGADSDDVPATPADVS
jgi:hypothetical protein